LVRADVGRQNGIRFVSEGEQPLALLDAPNRDLAGLAASSAPSQEQAAVPAEAKDLGSALGEWEDAEKIQTVGDAIGFIKSNAKS